MTLSSQDLSCSKNSARAVELALRERERSRADRKAYIPQLFLHTNRAGIRT